MDEIFPLTQAGAASKDAQEPTAASDRQAVRPDTSLPLCIDLDGTLVRTDMLFESLFVLLKRNPLYLFLLPLWLVYGKANLKQQIADRALINTRCLPYNQAFLDFLREQHRNGRRLVLATACHARIARQIAKDLGIFAEVIATDGRVNMSGDRKRKALRERFGERRFDYAGNAAVDLHIWRDANASILVNPPARLADRARRLAPVTHVFADSARLGAKLRTLLKAIRVHQWVKNLLVFVPLLTAHRVSDLPLFLDAGLAFLAFSLCSSSVYLLNDLLDLEADRLHPTKKNRAFASGSLSIQSGMLLAPLLLAGSVALALLLPLEFLLVLSAYFGLTLLYSFYLKQIALVDTMLLAMLYTARIIAGAAAIGVAVSMWLLAFSVFLFLSLAFVKRVSELHALQLANKESSKGRGYRANDLAQISNLGAASGYISVLVLGLYINSEEVTVLYSHPSLLWLICPLILYWVSRVWLVASRGQMHQDPIVFALKDRVSYGLGAMAAVVMLVAV